MPQTERKDSSGFMYNACICFTRETKMSGGGFNEEAVLLGCGVTIVFVTAIVAPFLFWRHWFWTGTLCSVPAACFLGFWGWGLFETHVSLWDIARIGKDER